MNGHGDRYPFQINTATGCSSRAVLTSDPSHDKRDKVIDVILDVAEAYAYVGKAHAETVTFNLAENHQRILKEPIADEAADLEAIIREHISTF